MKNPVASFWQAALIDGRIIELARKYRKEAGLPPDGYKGLQGGVRWINSHFENDDSRFDMKSFACFEKEAREHLAFRGVLSDLSFNILLFTYFFYGDLSDEFWGRQSYSEIDKLLIVGGRSLYYTKENLKDGIYIRFGPLTSIDEVCDYLKSNREQIKREQKMLSDNSRVRLAEKSKSHPNFQRDTQIVKFWHMTKKELEELGGMGNTKEEVVANLMRKYGYSKGIMNAGIVKSVTQRYRKMIKALK